MNTKLMASVSVLALVLGACASKEPKPMVETPEVIYKTAKVNAAVTVVPDWYKEMPEKEGSIFTVGAAVAPDLQFAVDIATMNAKVVLADRINGKLDAMMKTFVTRLGTDDDVSATTMSEVEKVTKNVIASVDVAGYNPKEMEIYPTGTQFRAYVLLEYSEEEARKIIMNRMMKDRMVYGKIRSTNAWKELQNEVDASKNEDQALSMSNIETEINKVVDAAE